MEYVGWVLFGFDWRERGKSHWADIAEVALTGALPEISHTATAFQRRVIIQASGESRL